MFIKASDSEKPYTSRNIKVTSKDHFNNIRPLIKTRAEQLKNFGKSALKVYTSLDLFGKPISLQYNGQEKFKSFYGTTMTLFVLGVMLFYLLVSFIPFVQRKNLSFSFLPQSKPMPDPINFGNYSGNLDWIIGVDIIDEVLQESINDSRYFNFVINFNQNSMLYPSTNTQLQAITVPCTNSKAFMTKSNTTLNQSFYQFYNMSDHVTLKETTECYRMNQFLNTTDGKVYNVTLQGNDISDFQTYVSIQLLPCANSIEMTCATPSEIMAKMENAVVRFYFNTEIFLPNGNIPIPVSNITMFYKYNIQQYFSQKYDLFLQQNQINDYWDILNIVPLVRRLYTFSDASKYSLKFVSTNNFGDSRYPILDLSINADKTKIIYERRYTNIKDFFIEIVGILNGSWIAGMAIGQFINSRLLKRDLINKNFWIIDDNDGLSNTPHKNKDQISKVIDSKKKGLPSSFKHQSYIDENEIDKSSSINKTNQKLNGVVKIDDNTFSEDSSFRNDDNSSTTKSDLRDMEVRVHAHVKNKWHNSESMLLPILTRKFSQFNMSLKQLIMSMFPCFKDRKLIVRKKIFNDCGDIINSFLDIETVVGIIREYQNLRNIVLSPEEYKMLRMITTPKIEIKGEDIFIYRAEKPITSEENLKSMYTQFAQSVNALVRSTHLTTAEFNLLELHKSSHLGVKDNLEEKVNNKD